MIVSLIGWEAEGLRCPDIKVDFSVEKGKKQINLVQMPNGTGKSTTIELISTALNGIEWNPNKVRQLKGVDNITEYGHFILKLNVSESEKKVGKEIVIQIEFNFDSGTMNFFTKKDNSVGLEIGWQPPQSIKPYLNDRCVDVFVFKGDKVDNLLSSEKNDAELSIKAFFGISSMEDFESEIDKHFSSKQVTSTQTNKGETQKKNVLEKWELHLEELKSQKKIYLGKLRKINLEYDVKKENYEKIINGQSQNQKELTSLEIKLEAAKNSLSMASNEAMSALRNPFFISINIQNKLKQLKTNLDVMKLPGTSIEFFHELTEQPNCVCDRPIHNEQKVAILKNATSYLSDEHVTIVNGIKKDVNSYIEKANSQTKDNPFIKITKANDDLRLINQNLDAVRKKIKDDANEVEKALMTEWESLITEKVNIETELEKFESTKMSLKQAMSGTPEACTSISITKKVIEDRQKELAEISNTVKQYQAKENLKKIIKYASDLALQKLNKELMITSNEKLKKILTKGTKLEILSISKNIQIGYHNKPQEKGSGGQNVAVAYSFATSILERSGIQFPLLVDHPFTALQESARREMAKILDQICHQFVGFVIDTEKQGFLPELMQSSSKINLITIFNDIEGNQPYVDKLPKSKSKFFRSKNGVVCYDNVFFEEFRDLNPSGVE